MGARHRQEVAACSGSRQRAPRAGNEVRPSASVSGLLTGRGGSREAPPTGCHFNQTQKETVSGRGTAVPVSRRPKMKEMLGDHSPST